MGGVVLKTHTDSKRSVDKLNKESRESLAVQDSELPLQGSGLQSLVVEIRSHKQSTGVAKRIKKKKTKHYNVSLYPSINQQL